MLGHLNQVKAPTSIDYVSTGIYQKLWTTS